MPTQNFEQLFYHLEQASKGAKSMKLDTAAYLLSMTVLEIRHQEVQALESQKQSKLTQVKQ